MRGNLFVAFRIPYTLAAFPQSLNYKNCTIINNYHKYKLHSKTPTYTPVSSVPGPIAGRLLRALGRVGWHRDRRGLGTSSTVAVGQGRVGVQPRGRAGVSLRRRRRGASSWPGRPGRRGRRRAASPPAARGRGRGRRCGRHKSLAPSQGSEMPRGINNTACGMPFPFVLTLHTVRLTLY